uniref:Uncharacterized protein n=1 Tax=Stomoxys calcitrans TaxID=35570 RepID=A0A1I8PKI7_STOCA
MKTLIIICFVCGILNVYASETNKANKITTTKQIADDTTAAATATASSSASVAATASVATSSVAKESTANEATKDKRQTKDTKDAGNNDVYANHRSDSITSGNGRSAANSDDPEDPQETIYGTDGRQFLIRPQQHSTQQSDEEQQQQEQQQSALQRHQPVAQLRNYPVTIRPHSSQLLEQSQELQHYAYLQDLNRPLQKPLHHGKSRAAQNKKSAARRQQSEAQANSQAEEAEQRYSVAVEQPVPQHIPRAHIYRPQIPYHVALQQQQQQQ